MADTTQREENLRAFREHFNLIRVELSIAASPESVIDVFSVVDITIAKNLIIDLVRILVLQSQPNALTVPSQNDHANHLSNLFSLGSNVFTDSFDIKLAIPLIEQVLNNEPEQKIRSAVSKLAARARLLFIPPAPSRKVASETQFSASNQVTESNSSTNYDETESRVVKRVKLTHGVLHENDFIGTGRKCDMGTPYPDNYYEPALERSPLFQYQPLLKI